ncbi:hypothetical protein AB0I60_04185 [Actinosynnema sp. NPDC050436]|uniref:hypothetical protein n=1 Tax=Actinosynnema sp. NPDC050436 TaxID=3155659 RepID=UPI00341024E3
MDSRGWDAVGAGVAAVRWRPRRRTGRHARARPSPTSPTWISALLALILLVSLVLLLLTYL